jgi:hypothetical protein
MEPVLREKRIESLRTKIVKCQQECSALAGKSSSPYLTSKEKTEIGQLRDQTIKQCHNLRHMLGTYEHEGQSECNAPTDTAE